MRHDTPIEKITLPNRTVFNRVAGLLGEGFPVTLTAKGNSMIPFIWGDKDKVVLRSADKYSVGDIVLVLLEDGSYVLHRIISIKGNSVLLMGDGNYSQTEPCTMNDIAGKVTHVIRKDRWIACDTPLQRIKARLWRHLLSVRRVLLYALRLWHSTIDPEQERSGICG